MPEIEEKLLARQIGYLLRSANHTQSSNSMLVWTLALCLDITHQEVLAASLPVSQVTLGKNRIRKRKKPEAEVWL